MVNELVKAVDADLSVMAGIYVVEFSKAPYNESWSEEKVLGKMKFYSEFYDLYSIRNNDEIVGFAVVNSDFMCPGDVAFLEEIAVREDMQGRGIGSWAIEEMFGMYKERGFKRFMCISNLKSRAYSLYKKLGVLPSEEDILIERSLE